MKCTVALFACLFAIATAVAQTPSDPPRRSRVLRPTQEPIAAPAVPSKLFQKYAKFMAIIEGDVGMGSGAILKYRDKTLLVTNAHVLSGNSKLAFKFIDGMALTPGALGIAHGHDVAIIEQKERSDGIEVMTDVDKKVTVGDDVVILGNSLGGGVVTEITGKIIGVGPNLVEVDAKFVKGNSGSPIVHVKSGKVIGVATYAFERTLDKVAKDSQFSTVIRLGVRLDTITEWDAPSWPAFIRNGALIEQVKKSSQNFVTLIQDVWADGVITLQLYQAADERLRRPIVDFLTVATRPNIAPQSVQQAKERFIRDLVFVVMRDLPEMPKDIDEFQANVLKRELGFRKFLKTTFEGLAKLQDSHGKINLP